MSSKPFSHLLGNAPVLSQLKEHAARLRRLQNLVERHTPPALRGSFGVANFHNNVLTIHADSAAITSRLTMLCAQLKRDLLSQNELIDEIRIKTRPQQALQSLPPRLSQRQIDPVGRQALDALKQTIDADTPLRQALEKLLKDSR